MLKYISQLAAIPFFYCIFFFTNISILNFFLKRNNFVKYQLFYPLEGENSFVTFWSDDWKFLFSMISNSLEMNI